MISLAVIADDLTGAADAGIQFGRFESQALLVPYQELAAINPESFKGVLTVSTESRNLSPTAAGERVRRGSVRGTAYQRNRLFRPRGARNEPT